MRHFQPSPDKPSPSRTKILMARSTDPTTRRPSPHAPASTLAAGITELVHAAFTGISIESREPDEAIRDLTRLARRESWRLGIRACDSGLTFPCAEAPVPVNPNDLSDDGDRA